jgi:nucleoside 2-deoxyribosyltransferase
MTMPTKVYLASRYSRRQELLGYRELLRARGIEVTGRWLEGLHEIHDSDTPGRQRVMQASFAEDDLEDIRRADAMVSFTEGPGSPHARGGRHVEFGYALALGKHLIVIGPLENVFYCLPGVLRFDDWDSFFRGVTVLFSETARAH